MIRGRMGGGIGIFGGRIGVKGEGWVGKVGSKGMMVLVSNRPIFVAASPIFDSGNFISPN